MTTSLIIMFTISALCIIVFRNEPLNYLISMAFLWSIYTYGICAGGMLAFLISFIFSMVYGYIYPEPELEEENTEDLE